MGDYGRFPPEVNTTTTTKPIVKYNQEKNEKHTIRYNEEHPLHPPSRDQKNGIACPFVAFKLQEGLLPWLQNKQTRWEGPIPPPFDVIGNLTFEAYLNQMAIDWDQAF